MKESQRQCIERHLEEFAAWRASGLTLTAYAQQRDEDLALWRGRLTWERRWHQMLEGKGGVARGLTLNLMRDGFVFGNWCA